MYEEQIETANRQQNSESRNRIVFERNAKEYESLKEQFKTELQSGKNVGVLYNKMINTINDIPDDLPAEIIKRALDLAGLAAVSKAPYLYGGMSRALTSSVDRCTRTGKLDTHCVNLLQKATESCERRLGNTKDAVTRNGLQSMKTALTNATTKAKGRVTLKSESTIYGEVEEMTEEDILVAEAVDAFLEHAASLGLFMDDEDLLQENLRSVTRQVTSTTTGVAKNVAHTVDTVGNTVRDQHHKNRLMRVRQEVMAGRAPLSRYLKLAVALVAIDTGVLPVLAIAPLVNSIMRRKRLRARERANIINELVAELEVVNEKIKDAEADNDRQKKYNYIRLRREIQRGIDQLRYGERLNIARTPIKL